MDAVQNPHDGYVDQQWVDLGNMQQHHHHAQQQHHHHQQQQHAHHPLSPHHHHQHHQHHQQDYGAHYGYVETSGFVPPDSFRLQNPPIPMASGYLGLPQQWGQQQSMPTGQHPQYACMPQQPIAPSQLAAAPTITASASNPTQSTSNPRRTLTDADRRRMCVFHEENPNVKQTEIGAMFGVERSTVSKVLRQKEKYLFPDDGSRSPVKRSKGKFPDIERALAVWVKNTKKQGITLTDVMIREKARFFATSLGISESHFKANSAAWLEKFKHKNNVHPNGRGRSESDVSGMSRARMGHSRNGSTVSSIACHEGDSDSPMAMKYCRSQDSADSPESYMPMDLSYKSFQHSGPTSPRSPFFSPDSSQPSPVFPSQQARMPGTHQRPRSQTFPCMPVDGSYISPPPSSEPLTPKLFGQGSATLASPIPEAPNQLASPHMTPSSSHTGPSSGGSPGTPSGVALSKDDAKKALEVVMRFLRQQPVGFVEQDDYVMVGKLLEKVGLNGLPVGSGSPIEAVAASIGFSTDTP